MQIFTDLLTSHWMDQYSYVQSPVDANLHRFRGIALNGSIFERSKSCQRKSLVITLNGPILARSKSCQCKSLQIS
uniref:Uncharacterized protein n=1 Tax=viral metagenome TaxID=1070528 RepID=A0A6C0C8H4_9ZZZZ